MTPTSILTVMTLHFGVTLKAAEPKDSFSASSLFSSAIVWIACLCSTGFKPNLVDVICLGGNLPSK